MVLTFVLGYVSDDYDSIFGDPTKFGLGLFSVCFDIFFMIQHYVLYRYVVHYINYQLSIKNIYENNINPFLIIYTKNYIFIKYT